MKKQNLLYWIFLSLFALSMLSGAALYFFNHGHAEAEFSTLGYPTYLIYPLGLAKILGVGAIIQQKWATIKEWAFAVFTCNLVLAFSAHFVAQDGEAFGPVLVLGFMLLTYVFDKKRINR